MDKLSIKPQIAGPHDTHTHEHTLRPAEPGLRASGRARPLWRISSSWARWGLTEPREQRRAGQGRAPPRVGGRTGGARSTWGQGKDDEGEK